MDESLCIWWNISTWNDNVVLYSEMVVLMDIFELEKNNVVLKRTVRYLDGEIKEIVEKQILSNLTKIDNFFDDLEREYQSINSYEEGGQNGN
ncbi:MAG: hypothetical protein Unbinned1966contig1000_25 [Prokaryotic dsDNA virus sp.]|nr:MAG: hypothetical protein Unbinned1966contig1000_25 [Prokaryotic dsDNA virus sp.]